MSTPASPMTLSPFPEGLIDGFERRRLPGDGLTIDALVGGSGPPLLLLHGYPQTRVMWRAIAPALAQQYTVVVPDLRGYGRSDKPAGDAEHMTYAKRTMARDQLATMRALGFDRFAVAGRGGAQPHALGKVQVRAEREAAAGRVDDLGHPVQVRVEQIEKAHQEVLVKTWKPTLLSRKPYGVKPP